MLKSEEMSLEDWSKQKEKVIKESSDKNSSGNFTCSIKYVELCDDSGLVKGVEATCSRCGHVTESYGNEPDSIRRCLALMREECPLGTRFRLRNFADDWDAPGMEAYDEM